MYTVSPYSARTSSVGTMIVAASASATRRVPRGAALDLGTSSFPETTALTGTHRSRRATRETRGDARERDDDARVVVVVISFVVLFVVANVEGVIAIRLDRARE